MKKELKYKIGDRVRSIKPQDGNKDTVGKCGTIIDILNNEKYLTVEFDVEIERGHRGYGNHGRQGYCWNVVPEVIEFENQYAVNLI